MSESEVGSTDLNTVIYNELREIAHRHMVHERPGHVLQTTALVHEAFVRLNGSTPRSDNTTDHREFYFAASRAMRHILVDHARKRDSAKRGSDRKRVKLDTGVLITGEQTDFLELHEVLKNLENRNFRAGRVVELRYYGGMQMQQIADLLGVSIKTVEKDWAFARAWLKQELMRET